MERFIIERKKRNISVNIDKSYIYELQKKQKSKCVYCNCDLKHDGTRNKKRDMQLDNLSVDRIDSNEGYTKKNTQLTCIICNLMKFDMTEKDFINNFVLPIANNYTMKGGKVCKKKTKKN
jgi:hypothetical protein